MKYELTSDESTAYWNQLPTELRVLINKYADGFDELTYWNFGGSYEIKKKYIKLRVEYSVPMYGLLEDLDPSKYIIHFYYINGYYYLEIEWIP